MLFGVAVLRARYGSLSAFKRNPLWLVPLRTNGLGLELCLARGGQGKEAGFRTSDWRLVVVPGCVLLPWYGFEGHRERRLLGKEPQESGEAP